MCFSSLSVIAMLAYVDESYAAEATGGVSATMIAPIAIVELNIWQFGMFAPTSSPGSVHVGRAGDVIATGGVELVSGIARHPAQFSVTGEPNATVSIATPVPSSIILANGLGDTMSINGLGVDPSQPLDGTGSLIFRIGGNLGVGANQAAGTYTGTFVVTVNYE